MRRLTEHERIALREVDLNNDRPVPDAVFTELARLGWGYWNYVDGYWYVTDAGRRALAYDDAARATS